MVPQTLRGVGHLPADALPVVAAGCAAGCAAAVRAAPSEASHRRVHRRRQGEREPNLGGTPRQRVYVAERRPALVVLQDERRQVGQRRIPLPLDDSLQRILEHRLRQLPVEGLRRRRRHRAERRHRELRRARVEVVDGALRVLAGEVARRRRHPSRPPRAAAVQTRRRHPRLVPSGTSRERSRLRLVVRLGVPRHGTSTSALCVVRIVPRILNRRLDPRKRSVHPVLIRSNTVGGHAPRPRVRILAPADHRAHELRRGSRRVLPAHRRRRRRDVQRGQQLCIVDRDVGAAEERLA